MKKYAIGFNSPGKALETEPVEELELKEAYYQLTTAIEEYVSDNWDIWDRETLQANLATLDKVCNSDDKICTVTMAGKLFWIVEI